MIARLFNAPLSSPEAEAVGVSTLGSSEAIILSVLAAKRRWQSRSSSLVLPFFYAEQLLKVTCFLLDARKVAGNPYDTPNMVMHSTVHVCWKKAASYLDIEERYTSCQYTLDPQEAVALVDENTILVCAILGSTYTGEYEDVQTLNDLLELKNATENLDVRIHVDAASGGFVAPFVCPELVWDFRLPLVCSINVSGHKCKSRAIFTSSTYAN
jgi:glutamate decarboxylase